MRLTRLHHRPSQHSFEARYEPGEFENIDRQREEVVYGSTLQPTQSNYFYSHYQPEYRCFVWQNIANFV